MKSTKENPEEFAALLYGLRLKRRALKAKLRTSRPKRKSLSKAKREEILASTGRRCHICGGSIGPKDKWEADHIQPHSGGGTHAMINYLPAHKGCNNYRWDYTPDEFHLILKLGVWTRTLIERNRPLGLEVARRFLAHERRRVGRRVKKSG